MANKHVLAHRARRHGAHYALRIIEEAQAAHILLSDAFALVEKESAFRNVFGHDWGSNPNALPFPGARVTERRAAALYAHVRNGGISNGVGLTQLTWSGYLTQAANSGGLATPRAQLRVGFRALAAYQHEHGRREGFQLYNGSGAAAVAYGYDAINKSERWHRVLTGS